VATSSDNTAAIEGVLADPGFEEALRAYAAAAPDPLELLKEHSIELPSDAELRVIVSPETGDAPEAAHGKHHKTCWEVCVGPSWARVCHTRCTSD
jgi:hypothetical protein